MGVALILANYKTGFTKLFNFTVIEGGRLEDLKPADVVRSKTGEWVHPELLKEANEKGHWSKVDSLIGYDVTIVDMDYDIDDHTREILFQQEEEAPDISLWNPSEPPGGGWFLIAIIRTAEGAMAWWARRTADDRLGNVSAWANQD